MANAPIRRRSVHTRHSPLLDEPAVNATAALNEETLSLLRAIEEDQPGSLAQLIRMFVADAPALLSRIELANERRDVDDLRHAAHYLRSAALALGAEALAVAALNVEHFDAEMTASEAAQPVLAALRAALRDAVISLLQVTPEL
jgi:HPt (histidine-containing phosphotransfer) domain-containing protein